MTSSLSCKYHPSRTAMDKCEQCGALICLDCKKIHKVTHTTSSSSFDDDFHSSDTYTTRHIFCPLCYYDNIEKAGTKGRFFLICPIIFVIIFFGVALFMFSFFLEFIEDWNSSGGGDLPGPGPEIFLLVFPIFLIVPIAILICMLRNFFIAAPRAAQQARVEREAFLREIGMESGFTPRDEFRTDSFKQSRKSFFCKTCGARISVDEVYCPFCGSSVE